MSDGRALLRIDHDSGHGRWTLFRRVPPPALAPYVREIQGYIEVRGPRILRKEVPTGRVPMILVFGPGFSLHDIDRPSEWRALDRSFIAGMHERHALVGSNGDGLCMQVDFTPWGAHRFLASDMDELAEQVIDLSAILGGTADRLEERLAEANDWEARFTLVEQLLARRILARPAASQLVAAAWQLIADSRGTVRVDQMARTLDCSRKHLAAVFRREIGLPPKALARIVRFESAVGELGAGRHASLAELAASCGYADQAHFNRDFLAFAGETPRDLRTRILPDGSGIMADHW